MPSEPWHADVFVAGIPKGQPRGRAFVTGGKPRIWTPGTAEAWKGDIARVFEPILPPEPLRCPVRLWIDVFLPRPKRLMRKKDPDCAVVAPMEPDWDNAGKAIADALQHLGVLSDDKVVVDGRVFCWYHAKGGRPGAQVLLEPVDQYGGGLVTLAGPRSIAARRQALAPQDPRK